MLLSFPNFLNVKVGYDTYDPRKVTEILHESIDIRELAHSAAQVDRTLFDNKMDLFGINDWTPLEVGGYFFGYPFVRDGVCDKFETGYHVDNTLY